MELCVESATQGAEATIPPNSPIGNKNLDTVIFLSNIKMIGKNIVSKPLNDVRKTLP
ncbi:hypothetical protein FACS1894166_01410 [Bacilli bacterium]|nr:hypothetical protein FACS1894166_01410 [Bacilli bacterium]